MQDPWETMNLYLKTVTSRGTAWNSSSPACSAYFQWLKQWKTGQLDLFQYPGLHRSKWHFTSTKVSCIFVLHLIFLLLVLLPQHVPQRCFLLPFLDPRSKVSLPENSRTHWPLQFFTATIIREQGRSISSFWNGSVQTQELLCLFRAYFRNWKLGLALPSYLQVTQISLFWEAKKLYLMK